MRFTELFGLSLSQAELDFVDVEVDTDLEVFIDPFAIATMRTTWCLQAKSLVRDYFQRVLDKLKGGDRAGALELMSGLREDNRTRLGYSNGRSQGLGLGHSLAEPFLDALVGSEAFKTGNIGAIEDAALFVDGIGRDIVSDIVTNIIRGLLAEYTQEQCRQYGIPLSHRETLTIWRDGTGWTAAQYDLPFDGDRAILLVPRAIVRGDLILDPDALLKFVMDQHDSGDARATRGLEVLLQDQLPWKKGGRLNRSATRQSLKDNGMPSKGIATRIVVNSRDLYDEYRNQATRDRQPLTADDIERIRARCTTNNRSLRIGEVVGENYAAAKDGDEAMPYHDRARAAVAQVRADLILALHPLLNNPSDLSTDQKGWGAFKMSCISGSRAFRPTHPAGNSDEDVHSGELIVLVSADVVDAEAIHAIDIRALKRKLGTSVAVLVGNAISSELLRDRQNMARNGIVVLSAEEIHTLAGVEGTPGDVANALDALLGV